MISEWHNKYVFHIFDKNMEDLIFFNTSVKKIDTFLKYHGIDQFIDFVDIKKVDIKDYYFVFYLQNKCRIIFNLYWEKAKVKCRVLRPTKHKVYDDYIEFDDPSVFSIKDVIEKFCHNK